MTLVDQKIAQSAACLSWLGWIRGDARDRGAARKEQRFKYIYIFDPDRTKRAVKIRAIFPVWPSPKRLLASPWRRRTPELRRVSFENFTRATVSAEKFCRERASRTPFFDSLRGLTHLSARTRAKTSIEITRFGAETISHERQRAPLGFLVTRPRTRPPSTFQLWKKKFRRRRLMKSYRPAKDSSRRDPPSVRLQYFYFHFFFLCPRFGIRYLGERDMYSRYITRYGGNASSNCINMNHLTVRLMHAGIDIGIALVEGCTDGNIKPRVWAHISSGERAAEVGEESREWRGRQRYRCTEWRRPSA